MAGRAGLCTEKFSSLTYDAMASRVSDLQLATDIGRDQTERPLLVVYVELFGHVDLVAEHPIQQGDTHDGRWKWVL